MMQDKASRATYIVFCSILCKQGVRGSNPLTSTNHLIAVSLACDFSALQAFLEFADFPQCALEATVEILGESNCETTSRVVAA